MVEAEEPPLPEKKEEASFRTPILVGDPGLRGKQRRLPDSLKANNPIARPPIELTGLKPGLDTHAKTGIGRRLPPI